MGREIQKKKRRSMQQPIRQSNRFKKAANPLGNNIIARNWDKKETLAQNYRRLGLTARLKAPTGGTETLLNSADSTTTTTTTTTSKGKKKSDPLAISSTPQAILSEAKVERDADGKIIRIISRTAPPSTRLGNGIHKPLSDPLNALDTDSEAEEVGDEQDHGEWGGIRENGTETDIVRSLIAEAKIPVEKKQRYPSEQEVEWLTRLVQRHGDDYQAMARDHKLNPMQQTAGDIKRRVKKMNA